MKILVTGAKGMIGSQLVKALLNAGYTVIGIDRAGDSFNEGNYRHIKADLADRNGLQTIVTENSIDRVIHLAALAHTVNQDDLSWERYYQANVECAKNVFAAAGERPVLFISTVDVFGFYDGKAPVNSNTKIRPVSNYGKSKAMAEEECRKLKHFSVFRFSPVYTDTIKRDIQKRYYLKYPSLAYQIGEGSEFEILNINKAVHEMVTWCSTVPVNDVRIIKDEKNMWTPDYIRLEKQEGRAKTVLRFPRWLVNLGYVISIKLFGENEKTYLLNKAVHPLRSE